MRLAHAHWRSLRSRRIEIVILNITAAVECIHAREIVAKLQRARQRNTRPTDNARPVPDSSPCLSRRKGRDRSCPILGFGPFRKMT